MTGKSMRLKYGLLHTDQIKKLEIDYSFIS